MSTSGLLARRTRGTMPKVSRRPRTRLKLESDICREIALVSDLCCSRPGCYGARPVACRNLSAGRSRTSAGSVANGWRLLSLPGFALLAMALFVVAHDRCSSRDRQQPDRREEGRGRAGLRADHHARPEPQRGRREDQPGGRASRAGPVPAEGQPPRAHGRAAQPRAEPEDDREAPPQPLQHLTADDARVDPRLAEPLERAHTARRRQPPLDDRRPGRRPGSDLQGVGRRACPRAEARRGLREQPAGAAPVGARGRRR